MDAGAEYGGYCSDVSRTFCPSGSFTPAQADLYQLVLDVQQKCIEVRFLECCTPQKDDFNVTLSPEFI